MVLPEINESADIAETDDPLEIDEVDLQEQEGFYKDLDDRYNSYIQQDVPHHESIEKHNKDGDEVNGVPELSNEDFAKRDEKGDPERGPDGRPQVDWEKYSKDSDGNGFRTGDGYEVKETILPPGTVIDRYGDYRGSFVSPADTPYEQRSLPYKEETCEYHRYEVKKPLSVTEGMVAENFGQIGGGQQYMLPDKVWKLEEEGYLEEIPDDEN